MRKSKSRSRAVCVAAALLLCAHAALPCSVPVFRYALDHWPADSFRLEVSPVAAKDPAVAKFLRNFGANSPLNIAPLRLPAAAGDAPSRLLFPPSAKNAGQTAWSGRLDAASLAAIIDSPARREIAKRILAGQSMVWTVVESGDPAKDDAVAQGVEKRLTFLETAAALPPPDPDDPSSEVGPGPPVRVKFSVLRVKRNDPAEGPFLAMLAGPHAMPADEPWIAPAFGRGRVLGSWPASAMSDAQIEEACLFLIAGCSCQVKDLNPGWDLLLNLDWEKELLTIGLAAEPAAADSPKPAAAAPRPETVTIHGAEKPPVTEMSVTPPANTTRSWISLGAAGLLLALGAAWRRLRRKI